MISQTEGINAIATTHKLDFEASPWEYSGIIPGNFIRFRVGTCEGLYGFEEKTLDILAVINNVPGNGHMDDVFEWFEYSCRENKKDLRVLECVNENFRKHLLLKRGFIQQYGTNVIKKITL